MFKLFTDGGSRGNPGPAAIGCILFDEDDSLVDFYGKYIGEATNNEAEYKALITGLALAQKNNIKNLSCYLDSELVVKQINKIYQVRHEAIKKHFIKIEELKKNFSEIQFIHVPREKNKFADKMVNIILDNKLLTK